MATIYLTLSAKTDTNPQREIRIRFKHGKIDQQSKTNIFIPAEYWDSEAQQIIIPNFRLMNDEKKGLKQYLADQSEKLNALTATVQTIFNDTDKDSITPDWLKVTIDKYNFPEKYAPKIEEPENITMFQFIAKFIKEAPSRKDKNTGRPLIYNNIQQYKATEKHLKDFAKSIRKKDFDFSNIDQAFYDKFVAFLQEKSFTQNSVGKHIRVFKLMLNEATTQNYNTNAYYNSFHVFTEETDTIYLNENELRQLKDTDFSKTPYLDRVRDWFLLLAWTGSRFSDLEKIARTDIKDGFITFRQQKTNAKVVIPLHPVVLEILEKYNYNLPDAITNQRFNEYIKEACRTAEIDGIETMTRTVGGKLVTEKFEKWEHVSSHTGRRSFCTNMYKRGLPTLMIMSISGHKTEKSFLKYIKVKQNEHAEMMKKAWDNMYK
jgi:integrase